jgi:hypothetical protein
MVADPITDYHRDQTARTARLLSMASATGIPATAARGQSEEEPLLGGRGDASQVEGESLSYNLWIGMYLSESRGGRAGANVCGCLGTAPIAQAGIWILAAIVWGAIFSKKLIFFSAHPVSRLHLPHDPKKLMLTVRANSSSTPPASSSPSKPPSSSNQHTPPRKSAQEHSHTSSSTSLAPLHSQPA